MNPHPENKEARPAAQGGHGRGLTPPKPERQPLDAAAKVLMEAFPDIGQEFSEHDVARHLDGLVAKLREIIQHHRL